MILGIEKKKLQLTVSYGLVLSEQNGQIFGERDSWVFQPQK